MKEKYEELLLSTKRENIDKLLEYLNNETDFFKAPASSRFHLAKEGGLLEHSMNVYKRLYMLNKLEETKMPDDSMIISALLHDVCKVNFYVEDFRNVKNDNGVWEKVPCYKIDDKDPYGHGEKSVRMIEKFIKLTDDEAYAIRWHMGPFSGESDWQYLDKVYVKSRLSLLMHQADVYASKAMEE